MLQVTLGSTGITVPQNGFGALPIQRISEEEAVGLLQKAYLGGIRFFDTARMYSDSESKLSAAFGEMREQVYIATKSEAKSVELLKQDLETSLSYLKYIDLYQFHNPSFCPKPGDGTGLYEVMLEAKAAGKIRHIGLTNHRVHVAREAIESGLYETVQFPFSYLASDEDVGLVQLAKQRNVGFIAMKGMSGGLITNSAAACAWMGQFENVLPIWGVQRERELDEFLSYMEQTPVMNEELSQLIEKDRKQLSGSFCRGCGYCMPCPMGIEINNCARMSLLLRRSPSAGWLNEAGQARMKQIEKCTGCRQCASKCPYGLDTPELLKENYRDYLEVLAGKPV